MGDFWRGFCLASTIAAALFAWSMLHLQTAAQDASRASTASTLASVDRIIKQACGSD